MNIVVSAFACIPNTGSEGGVGWNWAINLARTHNVTVLVDIMHQNAIENELQAQPIKNIKFIFYRPLFLRELNINSKTIYFLYSCWQIGILKIVRRLHAEQPFNLALHVTYGVFRQPTMLGFTGIPTAFGPVGGGEDAPFRLKKSISGDEKFHEIARYVVNKLSLIDPVLWLALSRCRWVFTKTNQTRNALPWPFRRRAIVLPEIGIQSHADAPADKLPGKPMKVLFVGRLLGWKGAHLAIRAAGAARKQGANIEFTVIGKGPYESTLRQIATHADLGGEGMRWINHMPQQQLFAEMNSAHLFVFPSLHDSSGNVVLEAQSRGLPVVCLDCGGPAALVTSETSIVISTKDASEQDVVTRIAEAIIQLSKNEPRRLAMAQAAIQHAGRSTWSHRVDQFMALIHA